MCLGWHPRSQDGFASAEMLDSIEKSHTARLAALKKLRSKSTSWMSAIRRANSCLKSDADGQMAHWDEYFQQG